MFLNLKIIYGTNVAVSLRVISHPVVERDDHAATGGCRPVARGCKVVNRVGVIRGGCAAENEREAANCRQGRGAPPATM